MAQTIITAVPRPTLVWLAGVSIGSALGQIASVHQVDGLLCSSNSSLIVSPAAFLAQFLDGIFAQVTNQVVVEVEVCVSAVQEQRLIAVVLQGLADIQELVPGLGGLSDAAGLESVLVIEYATNLGCSTMEFR